jgi:hypothetical protein
VVEIIALEDGSDDFWLRWPTRLGGPLACELRYSFVLRDSDGGSNFTETLGFGLRASRFWNFRNFRGF